MTAPLAISTWEEARSLCPSEGVILLLGGIDTGKTSLARYLWTCAPARSARLDLDPGQGELGPPGTLGGQVRLNRARVRRYRYFIGHSSPRGQLVRMLVGARKLLDESRRLGARWVLIDTCGFIRREGGGATFKAALIESLEPDLVLALEREGELEPIREQWPGEWLRRRWRTLRPPPEIRNKSPEMRRARRQMRFRRYFARARTQLLPTEELGREEAYPLLAGRLMGLLDGRGWLLALGLFEGHDPDGRLRVRTPYPHPKRVRALRAGRLVLDPETCEEIWTDPFGEPPP